MLNCKLIRSLISMLILMMTVLACTEEKTGTMSQIEIETMRRGIEERMERERLEREEHLKKQARLEAEQNLLPEITNPGDIALKKAMDKDPTFHVDPNLTGLGAISEYENILQRNDLTEEQRLFVSWTLAGLYCSHDDYKKVNKPDFVKSRKLYKNVMQMIPGFYSKEKFNAATMYGTHPGNPSKRAELLSEAYIFLKEITTEQLKSSAQRVNRIGFAIDKKFFSGIARLPDMSNEEKEQKLEKRHQDACATMENSIEEFLNDTNDLLAANSLLSAIEKVAPADKFNKWKISIKRISEHNTSERGPAN